MQNSLLKSKPHHGVAMISMWPRVDAAVTPVCMARHNTTCYCDQVTPPAKSWWTAPEAEVLLAQTVLPGEDHSCLFLELFWDVCCGSACMCSCLPFDHFFKSLMGSVAQQTSLPLHLESRAPCTYIYFPTCSAVPTFIHIYCRCVYGQESGNTVCIVIQGRQYDVLRHVAIYWHNNILCFFLTI